MNVVVVSVFNKYSNMCTYSKITSVPLLQGGGQISAAAVQ